MTAIPLVQVTDRNINQLQQNIKQAVDPLLSNALLAGNLLTNISLISGTNIINHGLGRVCQGWLITDVNAVAAIFRSEPFNSRTLTLVSDAACTVGLYVF